MTRLRSVNVGLPRDIAWKGRTVDTAIWKNPVIGPLSNRPVESGGRWVKATSRAEHRAVFVYQIEAYRYWQEQLKRTDFVHGQFGENFTVEGLSDDAVCVGDRYQIGSAVFEVTQTASRRLHRTDVRDPWALCDPDARFRFPGLSKA